MEMGCAVVDFISIVDYSNACINVVGIAISCSFCRSSLHGRFGLFPFVVLESEMVRKRILFEGE
jgi:hypothetical protein